jgi:hypothetical protein
MGTFLRSELGRVLPIFFFFLVSFSVINWVEAFLFERIGVTPFRLTEVAIAAALIAKIVMVADHLPFVHRYQRYPLAYGILWKTGCYWVLLLLVRLVIRFVPMIARGESVREEMTRFLSAVNWNLFISVQIYYLMLLFIFMTFHELKRKIGDRKMKELFFGSKAGGIDA